MESSEEHPSPVATPEDRPLPPVEAPTGRFIMQLFLIPLLIVGILGAGLFLFQRMMSSGADPHQLAEDIRRAGAGSWQKAYLLSNMLHNRQHAKLKKDRELCQTLIASLEDARTADAADEEGIRYRVFLCRALGAFALPDPIPELLKVCDAKSGQDLQVRVAAVAAVSVLADQLLKEPDDDTQRLLRGEVAAALIEISREPPSDEDRLGSEELQATVAYALGVIGGESALERLVELLDAGYPNVRYNAATGLAWHGDVRSIPVLLEMLDPDNPALLEGELADGGRRSPLTREEVLKSRQSLVMSSAVRAVTRLCRSGHVADRAKLEAALRRLTKASVPQSVRMQASEALILLREADQGATS